MIFSPVPKPKPVRQKKRFAALRDPAYCDRVRETQGCLLNGRLANGIAFHYCEGPLELAHVKSRGAGGTDRSNVVILCRKAHGLQHSVGTKTFQVIWRVVLADEAKRIEREVG